MRSASIADLISKQDIRATLSNIATTENLKEFACRVCESDPLVMQLLEHGMIDENYALYATQYRGKLSLRAMNFVLHSVQPNRADPNYQFGDPSDIAAIEEAEGERFLGGRSFLNYEVFKYYASRNPELLDEPIKRIVESDPAPNQFFSECLFQDGTLQSRILSHIVPLWPGVFRFLLSNLTPTLFNWDDYEMEALSKALIAASEVGSTFYEMGEQECFWLKDNIWYLPCFTEPVDDQVADRLAVLIGGWGIHLLDLQLLAQPQRDAIVARSLYMITLCNLRSALGKDASLSLDDMAVATPLVYRYMLNNTDDYLSALESAQVEQDTMRPYAIRTSGGLVKVLTDLLEVNADAVEGLVEHAAPDCNADLNEVDQSAWAVLVRTGRVQASFSNVHAYVKAFGGVDEHLARLLRHTEVITGVDGAPDADRAAIAVAILSCPDLQQLPRITLAKSLKVRSFLNPVSLTDDGIIPRIVGSLIADDSEVFNRLADSLIGTKSELVKHSTTVVDNLRLLTLSASDIETLTNITNIKDKVCDALVASLEVEEKTESLPINPRVGTLLATRLVEQAEAVTPTAFIKLAGSRAEAGALVQLLSSISAGWHPVDLRSCVAALPLPYCDIVASRSADKHIDVGDCTGLSQVLERLRKAGFITDFKPSRRKAPSYRVW